MKMRMLGLFLAVFFFVSCKQKVGHYDYIDVQKPSLKEELQQRIPSDIEKQEIYLRSLMDMKGYTVEDEKLKETYRNSCKVSKKTKRNNMIVFQLYKK